MLEDEISNTNEELLMSTLHSGMYLSIIVELIKNFKDIVKEVDTGCSWLNNWKENYRNCFLRYS